MSHNRTPLFAANWKMNKLISDSTPFCEGLAKELSSLNGKVYDVVICPPSTHLSSLKDIVKKAGFSLGGQNAGMTKFGAFTGETSPAVLTELGCSWVIIGHSERRHIFREEETILQARLKAALEEGLGVIYCVGEVLNDRKTGKTFRVLESQLGLLKNIPANHISKIVIAYEPVWAIGTGENATPDQAEEVHQFIRNWYAENISPEKAPQVRILYGGSVKPENSGALLSQKNVDGLLVGNASLDPVAFGEVIRNGLKGIGAMA